MVRRIIIVTLICIAATSTILALARSDQGKTRLLVHSGAALRPAMDELGVMFEKKMGVHIDYNYKGSGCLLPDVCMSKKGDVYIPGELYFMKQAIDRKIVKPDYKVAATMTTVIITQPGNPKNIRSLKDFGEPGIKLGLGEPEAVAIGRAARECLVKAKVWRQAKQNIAMTSQNVSELTNAVKMKHVDAAIVWDATASMYNDREMAVIAIPSKQTVCSLVPVGVVKFTQHGKEAQRFVDFLASQDATKVFVKHGFGAPPKAKACPTGKP